MSCSEDFECLKRRVVDELSTSKDVKDLIEKLDELRHIAVGMNAGQASTAPETSRFLMLHFNDVYDISGAPRFVSLVKSYLNDETLPSRPLVLFSGDAFNPSLLSVTTEGAHMVPVLNEAKVDVACFGNHDFDAGLQILSDLSSNCDFPWLMSNVEYKPTKKPLGNGHEKFIIQQPDGLRIGFLGLVESEWMATLSAIDEDDLEFEDFVACGERLGCELRQVDGCQVVVALTHMRLKNDKKLASETTSIDIILGGHDHEYFPLQKINKTFLLKSGTDFRDLSFVDITFKKSQEQGDRIVVNSFKHHEVDETTVPEEDSSTKEVVEKFEKKVLLDMSKVIGESLVDLDARFAAIRTRETNVSNFVADLMRQSSRAEIALLNSGSLRADRIIPAGPITLKDLRELLPMVDPLSVILVPGKSLEQILENGVSKYPAHEGRFPCVSGVTFKFDPSCPPGERVVSNSIIINGEPLDLDRKYTVCTKTYLTEGKDGYDAFAGCEVAIDDDCLPILPTVVRYYFLTISVLNGFKLMASNYTQTTLRAVNKFYRQANVKRSGVYYIEPKVEGRIIMAGDQ